jgi:hypothetical protein
MKRKFFPSAIFTLAALAIGATGAFFSVGPVEAIIGMPMTPGSYAGVARRTARRTAYAGAAATTAYAGAAAATSAAAASNAAAANAAAANAAAAATVAALPPGCVNAPPYYNCNGVMYQPAYQGGNVVYAPVR